MIIYLDNTISIANIIYTSNIIYDIGTLINNDLYFIQQITIETFFVLNNTYTCI